MSANHKRPLFAFVLLALACSMIMANGIRSQAVVSVVRAGAQHLVAGVELFVTDASAEPAPSDSEPELTPVGPVEVAAQQVFGVGHSEPEAGHLTTRGLQATAPHTHSRSPSPGTQHGHPAVDRAHGHAHENGKGQVKSHGIKRGVDHTWIHGKGHGMKPGIDRTRIHGKGHGMKLGIDRTRSHGKSHARGHQGHTRGHQGQNRDD